MSQPRVRWGQAKRFFDTRGFTIYGQGGDKVIVAPPGWEHSGLQARQTVRIGHNYSNHAGDELSEGHIGMIRRAFGVTRKQLLGR